MNNTVLILNGSCKFFNRGGSLNNAFSKIAVQELQGYGLNVMETKMASYKSVNEEVEKILRADVIILQSAVWAMCMPWPVKKYVDEVMTQPEVCGTDGRTRELPDKTYGSGGVLKNKHYLISTTWNAPEKAFTHPAEFFSGLGVDAVLTPWHKQFQYMGLGLRKLPDFCCFDVYKNPQIERDFISFKKHLNLYIKPLFVNHRDNL